MTTTTKGVLYSLEFEDGYEYYMESEYLGKTYVMCYREDRLYTMRKTGDDYDGYSEEMSRDEFFEEYWTATDVSITASMLKEATVVREGDKLTVTYEGVSQAFGNALLSTTGEWQDLVEEEEEASFTVTACSFELVIEKGIRKTATMSATGDITDEEGKVLSTISVNSENEYMDYGPDADFEVPLPDNLSQLPDYEEYWEDQDDGLIGL